MNALTARYQGCPLFNFSLKIPNFISAFCNTWFQEYFEKTGLKTKGRTNTCIINCQQLVEDAGLKPKAAGFRKLRQRFIKIKIQNNFK